MNEYAQDWRLVNRRLVAKMLAELEYERALEAQPHPDGGWRIVLPGSDWLFSARRGIWGWLWIDSDSVRCEQAPIEAQALLLQLAPVLGMNDAQTAEHLEDLYATLRGDLQLLHARRGMSARDLIALDGDTLQCLLSGHPKFVFNKGRRGWGLDDLQRYAPEYRQTFRLYWLAVKRERVVWSSDRALTVETLLHSAMDDAELQRFRQRWQALALSDDWLPMPTHPWQWQKKIALHFLPQLAENEIVALGEFGDRYLAQQSLRTLTNASRRAPLDIKLPLTIYNTSCYRGIPGKYIAAGPLASRWLQQIATSDATLRASGAVILGEPAAGYLAHTGYQPLTQAPYRYQEMLGVIWRENPSAYLQPDERQILLAALMECDEKGAPLIGAYIAQSGLPAEAWLRRLFRVTVVPLYHLLCRYGVSLIAHGQNITLALKEGVPQRVLLKDFQGDMRLTEEDFPERRTLPKEVGEVTARLTPDYLIHDLQTGHFVTVLRFVSPLTERLGVGERRFYQLLGEVLRDYMAEHPQLADRFALFDLFKPQIIRVVLNPVKLTFSEHDGGSRMLPNYLKDLTNPLWLAAQESAS
ncbi:aerobactin synthase IucC [Brenneria goodwinii]|uniref:aerobactin synthase IucC n=1 Tax=Brenneria goodwinii TaxID=1109412 RepID=UPI0036EC7E38